MDFKLSPSQEAFKKTLKPNGLTIFNAAEESLRSEESIDSYLNSLDDAYRSGIADYRKRLGLAETPETPVETLDAILMIVSFVDEDGAEVDYDVFMESYGKTSSSKVEEKAAKKKAAKSDKKATGPASKAMTDEQKAEIIQFCSKKLTAQKNFVFIDDLKDQVMKQFNIGGLPAYRTITDFAAGKLKVSGVEKFIPTMEKTPDGKSRRAYWTESLFPVEAPVAPAATAKKTSKK